jgi:hypothetical protein
MANIKWGEIVEGAEADWGYSCDSVNESLGSGSSTTYYLDHAPKKYSVELYEDTDNDPDNGYGTEIDSQDYYVSYYDGTIVFDSPAPGTYVTAVYCPDVSCKSLPDLAPGESVEVCWWVKCIGPGRCSQDEDCDVVFSLEAEADGACGPVVSNRPTLTVYQLPLTVKINRAEESVVNRQTFSVDAVLSNYGCVDPHCPCDIPNVTATINIGDAEAEPDHGRWGWWRHCCGEAGEASLVPGDSATKFIGTVSCGEGAGMSAQWTVRCDRPGWVKITVTATVEWDGKVMTTTSRPVYVEQDPTHITWEVNLAKDWNFMSIPIIPINPTTGLKDTSIEEVLYTIDGQYTEVWGFAGQEWQLYVPGWDQIMYDTAGIEKLTNLEPGVGYIIRMIYPAIASGQGYELEPGAVVPVTFELLSGWNLTGFKTLDLNDDSTITQAADTMSVGYYLANLDVNNDGMIIGHEARFLRMYEPGYPTGTWKELVQSANMWIGKGCWLWASIDDLVLVPPIQAE